MKPASFSYLRPNSVEQVLEYLASREGDAKLIAGGQSLAPMMNMRLATPDRLIDLNDLTELAYVLDAGNALEIGALTRHCQIAQSPLVRQHCPLLSDAAQTIGHYAIRQRGTLGGSLAHADPAAQFALIAVTLDAELTLARQASRRQVSAKDFFLSAMTTTLEPDELILCARFPKAATREAAAFKMFNRRRGDYAIVAAAATLAIEDGVVSHARLGVSGVAPIPLALDELARSFAGRAPSAQWAADFAAAAREAVNPEEDGHIPSLYRKELTQHLVAGALLQAIDQLRSA